MSFITCFVVSHVRVILRFRLPSHEIVYTVLRPSQLNPPADKKRSVFSLSASPFILWGYLFKSVSVFLLHLFIIFFFLWVGLPEFFSNNSPFSTEHTFVSFNELNSLVCWCTVIQHHRPQGATLFRRVRRKFTRICSVMRIHVTSCFKSHPIEKTIGNIQLILYPRGLQQNKRREW